MTDRKDLQKVGKGTSLLATMAEKLSIDCDALQRTLMTTVMPSGATNEHLAAFLIVCNKYDLNPVLKEIYAFPGKAGGISPIIGIDGWLHLANSHPQFDGMEFVCTDDDKGNPYSVTCRVYRKDRRMYTEVTEFYSECYRNTDAWKISPKRMLRHRSAGQCIRYAFGFSGLTDEGDASVVAQYRSLDRENLSAPAYDENAPQKPQKESQQTK